MRIQVKKNGVWREVSFEELCALRDAERRAVQTAFEKSFAATTPTAPAQPEA